ncbi:MAG: hypothetical protein WA137_03470 [Methanothrix sp.]
MSETVENMTIVEMEKEMVFEVLACLYKRLEDIFDMETDDSFIKDLPWRDYFHSSNLNSAVVQEIRFLGSSRTPSNAYPFIFVTLGMIYLS